MPFTVKLRYLRIAPRKVRLVADLIREKPVEEAKNILSFTTKKAALPLLKLLNSATNNARNDFQLEESNLYISKIIVDEGPKYKRWMPRARGAISSIQKKTSHITLTLDEINKKAKPIEKSKKIKETKEKEKVISKAAKPKFQAKKETPKPKIEKGIRKVFRRKAF